MPKDDAVYLAHMRESAGKIVARTTSKTRAEFDGSEDLQLVLAFLIQNLGEAAARVSAERCEQHPEIPWRQIAGMRDRLTPGLSCRFNRLSGSCF